MKHSKLMMAILSTAVLALVYCPVFAMVTHDFATPGEKSMAFGSGNSRKMATGKPVRAECVIDLQNSVRMSPQKSDATVTGRTANRAIALRSGVENQRAYSNPGLPQAQGRSPSQGQPAATAARPLLPPDLVVSFASYTLQACTVEGKYTRMKISATVKNQGKGPALSSGLWGIGVTAYPNVALTVPKKYSLIPKTYGPKKLNPGESISVQLDLVIGPSSTNSSYGIVVQVDFDNTVRESNENNNMKVSIKVPALKSYCTAQ